MLKNKVCDTSTGELPQKYAVIGFDCALNPIDVFYNPIDEKSINVFHAMQLRNSTIKRLGI